MSSTELWNVLEIPGNLAQENTLHNEGLRQIEGRFSVKDRDLAAPPGSPVNGDTYLVAAGAAGAWAGKENNIAHYYGQAWNFYPPSVKNPIVYVEDEDIHLYWSGSAYTQISGGGGGSSTFTGLTDTPSSYSGNATKGVRVNSGETALEFYTPVDTSGRNWALPHKGARVSLSATQAITAGNWQDIAWATEDLDTDGFWVVGNPSLFTIPSHVTKARLWCSAYFADFLPAGTEVSIYDVTGAADVAYAKKPALDPVTAMAVTPVLSVSSGQQFKARIRVTGSDRALSNNALTWFALEVIETTDATNLVEDFLDLADTPGSYTGHASKSVRVKGDETGLEFITAAADTDEKAKVSANDTTAGYLFDKLTVTGLTKTEAGDGGNETLNLALPAQPYVFAGTIPDKPAASQTVLLAPVPDGITATLPASLTGSKGRAKTAATAQTDFDIQKNGVSVGTMRFAASGTTATFIMASQTTLDGSAGDYLEIIAPATADSTLAKIGFSLKGTR